MGREVCQDDLVSSLGSSGITIPTESSSPRKTTLNFILDLLCPYSKASDAIATTLGATAFSLFCGAAMVTMPEIVVFVMG